LSDEDEICNRPHSSGVIIDAGESAKLALGFGVSGLDAAG
jgi:hypothetical protein